MNRPLSAPSLLPEDERSRLLDALQKQLLERASPALDRTLGAVDDYLFDRSQKGEEDLGLMALRAMRHARSNIVQRFQQLVANGFAELRVVAGVQGTETVTRRARLSLLSDQDLEAQLATEQLASSVLRQHAPAFEVLDKRMAALAGDALAPDQNPLNPVFLATTLGEALEEVESDDDLRIVVFKYFERELGTVMPAVLDRANALLAAAGILPELRANSGRPQQAPQPQQQPQMQQMPQPDPAALDMHMQASAAEQAMFANMLGMLQGWRRSMGLAGQAQAAAPGMGGFQPAGPTLGTTDLLSILSLMQRDAPSHAAPSDAGMSLAQHLRQQMAQSARKLGVADDNMQLDGLDSDAVDLVALLFDVLLDGPQYDANIRRMIGRMLVPYVKVAVKDRRMFLFKEHPARRLLNTVAEACEGNHGEAPQERALLTRVDHTIDRLVAEFNEDVAIFETLESELRGYMSQHRKRFELAEKRSTEAQRGRERLQQARAQVADDLSRSRSGRELPPVIEDFFNRHAAHHLAQVLLRDGHQSPRYDSAMRAIEDLLVAFDWASDGESERALKPLPEAEMREIFASSGCHGEAANAAIDALHDALARIVEGESAVESDVRMPEQVVVPEPEQSDPQLEFVAGNDTLDYDGSMLARMRALKIGHWLQLVASNGHAEPAKVSWISPISSRLLLVNRRGIRVLVASVEELAAMAKIGKVSLREAESAFEDAMHQVAGRLKTAASSV